jgi:hypothetical protein
MTTPLTADVIALTSNPASCLYVAAALTAGAKSAIIAEPSNHLYGMGSCIGEADHTVHQTYWGLNGGIYQWINQYYNGATATGPVWRYEPSVAHKAFDALLGGFGSKLTVLTGEQLLTVSKTRDPISGYASITGLTTTNYSLTAGTGYGDGSYEGDLMRAVCPSTYGRESTTTYGESGAGMKKAAATAILSPALDSNGQLLGADWGPPPIGADGSADHQIQAYAFRLVVTQASGRIPWPKPPGYNRNDFVGLIAYVNARGYDCFGIVNGVGTLAIAGTGALPNGKFDVNWINPGGDFPGASLRWPTGTYATRKAITDAHYYHQAGAAYTLANDSAVNAALRNSAASFGLCPDEHVAPDCYVDTTGTAISGWPAQLYVREASRMIGQYVLTQGDLFGTVSPVSDSIGRGGYHPDCHPMRRYPNGATAQAWEGDPGLSSPTKPWPIPLRACLPRRQHAANLVVPTALSASHVAFCAARIEETWMILGESCGYYHGLAAAAGVPPWQVGYAQLYAQLKSVGAIL